jgi:predicted CXXCH cytochrome family protein
MAGVNPGTGIKQTSHDLSSGGVGAAYDAGTAADPTLDRVCIYCHAPHHSKKFTDTDAVSYMPLWNHAVSTISSFETYTNGTDTPNGLQHSLNAADTMTQPGSVSKLCLSCHDGSVAISTYGFSPSGTTYTGNVMASGRIGIGLNGDLKNHHPIGFVYDDVAAKDDEIAPSDSSLLGANVWGLTIGDLMWGGKMECSSCHDVHNTKNEGSKFTWVQDTRSNLCLTCHLK